VFKHLISGTLGKRRKSVIDRKMKMISRKELTDRYCPENVANKIFKALNGVSLKT
jgi:hypothetical protein